MCAIAKRIPIRVRREASAKAYRYAYPLGQGLGA